MDLISLDKETLWLALQDKEDARKMKGLRLMDLFVFNEFWEQYQNDFSSMYFQNERGNQIFFVDSLDVVRRSCCAHVYLSGSVGLKRNLVDFFTYIFTVLPVDTVIGDLDIENKKVLKLAEQLGFEIGEGVIDIVVDEIEPYKAYPISLSIQGFLDSRVCKGVV